jgi:hypothetical protein
MAEQRNEFEYDQLLRSYHEYLQVAVKGISVYLLLIAACLTLPNSLNLGSGERNLVFREMCRMFGTIVTLGMIIVYTAASFGLWSMHKRARVLAGLLDLSGPTTWLLPLGVWVSCTLV